jgi:xylulokinase
VALAHEKNLVLALDVGTSSCKGAVYSRNGLLVAEASASYSVQRPLALWVEQ